MTRRARRTHSPAEYDDSFIDDFITVRMILSKAGVVGFPENLEIVDEW